MKKFLSILSVLSLTVCFAFANEPVEEFNFDQSKIDAEFDQLNKIEKYVEKNDVTLEELQSQNADLVSGIDLSSDASASIAAGELPIGIPAFWWGCVLGLLGVILVYVLTDQDKDQTKKALFGCLAWGVVFALYYLFVLSSVFI
ncbi:MAG: thiol:disulfide interchange protein [Arcticibacterium sp.]|jgi:thiol:disulfide interchange protein